MWTLYNANLEIEWLITTAITSGMVYFLEQVVHAYIFDYNSIELEQKVILHRRHTIVRISCEHVYFFYGL